MHIDHQIKWEQECLARGAERYWANQDRLREHGDNDQTDVMSYLIRERLLDAGEDLKEFVHRKCGGRAKGHDMIVRKVSQGDYARLVYLALKSVLKAVQHKDKNTVAKIAVDIGNRIEVDLKCQMFEAANPAYYDTVRRSFSQQNVTDYIHKNKVLMKKFSDFDIEWNHWGSTDKVNIGARILRSLLNSFGDVFFIHKHFIKGKQLWKMETTVQFDDWAAEFEKERGLLSPMYLPLKIPPRAWTSNTDGGYYTAGMNLKFVKSRGKEHRAFVEANPPVKHMRAVNKMQRTAWSINNRVLEVQEEIYQRGLGIGIPSNEVVSPPPFPAHLKDVEKEDLTDSQKEEVKEWKLRAKSAYGKEQQRKGKVLAFMQSHKLAKEFRHWEKLYFAYTCDFRGRIYCATAGLSPQGADTAKGLLKFAKGLPLGQHGAKWLAIHLANTYGEDKRSFEGRVQWVKSMEQNIRRTVEDPIGAREWWGAADKPYQFLAACFEWVDCDCGRNRNAMSSIPIGLDGSCNGLQHFSAILQDAVGAAATNLVNAPLPSDIYQEVANVAIKKLEESEDPMAKKWLQVGITRKCAKRPVMTLPYGATQTSARSYILEYTIDNWAKFKLPEELQWTYAKFLTPILWESIGEVVIAAREAMDWIQKNVGGGFCQWKTPIGFPVYQYYKEVKKQEVHTQIDGHVRLTVRDLNLVGTPKKSHQRNGIAPNFIHSIDSTHMVMTIVGTDFDSYAMIHDDFGTHAGNTELLYVAIRKAFRKLYTEHKPLHDWAEQQGIDHETLPATGTYDVSSIIDATYFFG